MLTQRVVYGNESSQVLLFQDPCLQLAGGYPRTGPYRAHMNCSLNSVKRVWRGLYRGVL